jgi:NADPH:quinone reductase
VPRPDGKSPDPDNTRSTTTVLGTEGETPLGPAGRLLIRARSAVLGPRSVRRRGRPPGAVISAFPEVLSSSRMKRSEANESSVRRVMSETMRAVVLDGPGPPSALEIREIPIPDPRPGWVLIKVMAFGLNRSELHTRLGLSEGVTFPRVLGIEATGIVAKCPGGELEEGQQVATMMGDMGRTFDGGYAEYTCVPAGQVLGFRSDLAWSTLGAVPEMLQTSYGSLTTGLDGRAGQTLLIRGGTSSIGMATAVLAKQRKMTVLSTTRSSAKEGSLRDIGVDHVLIDEGTVASKVRSIVPDGVDCALELVGTPTLPDTLRSTRVQGVVCFTGMLSNEWIVKDFYPIAYIPTGVRLTAYGGEASDLPASVLQSFLDAVAAEQFTVPIDRCFGFDEIQEAHAYMEEGRASGKLVVVV